MTDAKAVPMEVKRMIILEFEMFLWGYF